MNWHLLLNSYSDGTFSSGIVQPVFSREQHFSSEQNLVAFVKTQL